MHESTVLSGALCFTMIFCGVLMAFVVKLRDQNPWPPKIIAPIVILTCGIMLVGSTTIINEISLEHRDTAMQAQLTQAGINMVGIDWSDDGFVVVRAKGCTATFQIKEHASPSAWPLVSGTGQTDSDSGCGSQSLDALFIRP